MAVYTARYSSTTRVLNLVDLRATGHMSISQNWLVSDSLLASTVDEYCIAIETPDGWHRNSSPNSLPAARIRYRIFK